MDLNLICKILTHTFYIGSLLFVTSFTSYMGVGLLEDFLERKKYKKIHTILGVMIISSLLVMSFGAIAREEFNKKRIEILFEKYENTLDEK